MNELVVVAFADELKADEGLVTLRRRQKNGEIVIRDAAIALKTQRGKLEVRQTTEISTSRRRPPDGWWGLLIALLLGGAMGRNLYGDRFDSLYGRLSELGIDDEFVAELSETIEPGQSALFLLIREAHRDVAMEKLQTLGGHVLSSPLPEDSVRAIRATDRSATG